jgi:hypothetical protein
MLQHMLKTNTVKYRDDFVPAILVSQKTPHLHTSIETQINKNE